MDITLHYKTTRKDLATFYWRAWRIKLWMFHATILFVALAASIWLWQSGKPDFYSPVTFAIVLLVFLLLYPQLQYKPQVRVLNLNEVGITTTIGNKSGARTWAEIANIEDTGKAILISRNNMNAFIIPYRAFTSLQDRETALALIMNWHSQALAAQQIR